MRTHVRKNSLHLFAHVRASFPALLSAIIMSCGSDSERPGFTPDSGAHEADASVPPIEGGQSLSACDEARLRVSPVGCEYLVFTVPDGSSSNEGCTALFLSNPSERPARIEIVREGKALDITASTRLVSTTMTLAPGYEPLQGGELPPGASAVVALHESSGPQFPITEAWGECPFPALVDESNSGYHWVGNVPAFQVRTSEPVFATYVYPYAYSWKGTTWKGFGVPSSTALRSSGSWGTSNIDVGMFIPGRPVPQHEREGNPIYDDMAAFLAIGSVQDAKVRVSSSNGMEEIDVPAGRVIRLTRDDRFIGSAITSDVPIATFVGARLALLPYNYGEANAILDQVPSPAAWGSEYAGVRYPDRYPGVNDTAIYRIIGAKDGTKLSYEPSKPDGAPDTVSAGQLAMFMTGSEFVVHSQDDEHHFHMTVAMTSSEYVQPDEEWKTGATGRGGPELVSLVARKEFARRFAFMTEHSYSDVHLVLVRAKENGIFHPVTLGCAGIVTGWRPLGAGDTYETTTVTLSAGRFEPQVYSGGTCHNGPHTIQSNGPFTGYVWEWTNEKATGLDPPEAGAVSLGFALYGLPAAVSSAAH